MGGLVTVDPQTPGRLADYLRARRSLARPEEHGIPVGSRRTPGLRREEVAMLADVSTDYYSRLEQGRERNPSTRVVEALAGAFLLDEEAAAYLRGLAGGGPSRATSYDPAEFACSGLVKLMAAWPATPAIVQGRYTDVLAANELAEALFGWLGEEPNLIRAVFLEPAARTFYRDWDMVAQRYVAALRAANTDPADARLSEFVAELSAASPEFLLLWERQEVLTQRYESRRLHHPVIGDLSLLIKSFVSTSSPGQNLVVYYAEPGSPDEKALARLRRAPASTDHPADPGSAQ